MLKNNLLTALRHLARRKGYTFLNITGLALGLACFGFISIWVHREQTYDAFNKKSDRIYRLAGHVQTDSEAFSQAVTSPPMGPALAEDFPEVAAYVRLDMNDAIVKAGKKQFREDGLLFTDPSFFEVFNFELLKGDTQTALREPYSVVLTESMASKYFGDGDPVGEALTIFLYDPEGRGKPYQVTGVVADPPANAHFHFQLLGSFSTAYAVHDWLTGWEGWFSNFMYTYLLLKEGASSRDLEKKLPAFAERHMGDRMEELGMHYDYTLQPLKQIYLHSDLRYEIGPTGEAAYLPIFLTIGFFILLLACINYMNLATARSIERTREIGVKKILGARRGQLLGQFMVESVLVALVAAGLGLILMELLRPAFYRITGYENAGVFAPPILLTLFGAALGAGLLAGAYPALLISAGRPLAALRGLAAGSRSSAWVRRSLVVFQFSISVGLIIAVLVVNGQMEFIQRKDLGFDKEGLFFLRANGYEEVVEGYDAFREELLRQPGVEGVATSNSLIIGGLGNGQIVTEGSSGEPVSSSIYRLWVDYDYLDVYEIDLLAGRQFSRNFPADSSEAFLVNAAALNSFGWGDPEAAIGKPVQMGNTSGRIVGVVDNFHFSSLREAVQPVLLGINSPNFSRIAIRSAGVDPETLIQRVEAVWEKHFPEALYDYGFFESQLLGQYQAEQRFARLFFWFSTLSLLIACLGLFGLAAFSAERRAKEISIRKVLGASVLQLIALLNRDFLRLVILSLLIAAPVAWYFMSRWLENFAYHVEMQWWMPALAGGVAIGLALATVSLLSVHAANVNPAEQLRDE